MSAKLFQITRMMKHDSLRFTCRSGRIKNISQIVIRSTSRTLFHHIIVRKSFSHRHKLIKIDGRHITGGLVCTAFLLLPALFLVPVAGKKRD